MNFPLVHQLQVRHLPLKVPHKLVTKFEKLKPSLEPSHAFSVAIKEAKKFSKDTIIVVNSCGDAYKDKGIIEKKLGKKYVKSN